MNRLFHVVYFNDSTKTDNSFEFKDLELALVFHKELKSLFFKTGVQCAFSVNLMYRDFDLSTCDYRGWVGCHENSDGAPDGWNLQYHDAKIENVLDDIDNWYAEGQPE